MDELPDFRLKGKKLIIDLNSPLIPATTYVINFGDAIVDLTEGNKAAGLQYVFSTGEFLDSLQFTARVTNAFDQKPAKDILVMLYSNLSDTMPYKGIPDYFGKTDQAGNVVINFIREGKYRAIALGDENSNYKYNPPLEPIGFADSLVIPSTADSSAIPWLFRLFLPEDTIQYVSETKSQPYGELLVVFHQPADSVQVIPLETEQVLVTEQGVMGDSLWIWMKNRNTFTEMERTRIIIKADSSLTDTVKWNLTSRKGDSGAGNMQLRDNLFYNFNPHNPLVIKFNHPIVAIDTGKIAVFRDSVEVDFSLQRPTTSERKIEIHHDWTYGDPYRIFIPEGTFTDMFGLVNDTLDKTVLMRPERYFGKLALHFLYDETTPVILQLMNEKGSVVKEITPDKSGVIEFPKLLPGGYSARVIEDLNRNGKWDTGNFDQKLQPEPVIIFPSTIQVRSNWDMEVEWDLRQKNPSAE